VRWDIVVSTEINEAVQQHLLSQDSDKKNNLSQFVEKAVRAYLFKSAVTKIKQAFSELSEEECAALIEEVIHWARSDTISAKSQTEKSPNAQ